MIIPISAPRLLGNDAERIIFSLFQITTSILA